MQNRASRIKWINEKVITQLFVSSDPYIIFIYSGLKVKNVMC